MVKNYGLNLTLSTYFLTSSLTSHVVSVLAILLSIFTLSVSTFNISIVVVNSVSLLLLIEFHHCRR